jgi:hypothetical protein
VLTEALKEEYVDSHPVRHSDDGSTAPKDAPPPGEGYSDEESEAVRDRLKGLGYLQ